MKTSFGADGTSGNGARMGRAHSRLAHIHVSHCFPLFLVWESSVLSGAPLEVMRGWGETAGGMSQPAKGRGQETFQKHLNTLLSSKEPDTGTPSGTTLLGSRASQHHVW